MHYLFLQKLAKHWNVLRWIIRVYITYTHWREILVMKENIVFDAEGLLRGDNCVTIVYGSSLIPKHI